MKRNSSIDLVKICLALLVISIHYPPFTGNVQFAFVNILARIADPLFFTISAYLFFSKNSTRNLDIRFMSKYVKRVGILYSLWCLIYSPIYLKNYFNLGFNGGVDYALSSCIRLVRDYLSRGLYGALWFLPALIWGMVLTSICYTFFKPKTVLVLSCPFYLLSTVAVEYHAFTGYIPFFAPIESIITIIFGRFANGLTFGFFFCALGGFISTVKENTKTTDYIGVLVSFLLLGVEAITIRNYGWGTDYWALFFLIPTTYYTMKVLISHPLTVSDNWREKLIVLQKMSILIFTSHQLIGYLLASYLYFLPGFTNPTIRYFEITLCAVLFALCIVFASDKIKALKLLY